MPGVVCLQGGAEFGPRCRDMDAAVLARASAGPVVVVALAATPGHDHDTTIAHAAAYYESLGAAEVLGAPDARDEPAAAREVVARAGLVVLPGGSPARLLTAVREAGLDDVLRDALARGVAISGASAGAMALCAWTLLPEAGDPELVPGLGLVPRSLVLPHFSGDTLWLDAVRPDLAEEVVVLGLPECAGVLVDGTGSEVSAEAVGAEATRLLGARDDTLPVGASVAY